MLIRCSRQGTAELSRIHYAMDRVAAVSAPDSTRSAQVHARLSLLLSDEWMGDGNHIHAFSFRMAQSSD